LPAIVGGVSELWARQQFFPEILIDPLQSTPSWKELLGAPSGGTARPTLRQQAGPRQRPADRRQRDDLGMRRLRCASAEAKTAKLWPTRVHHRLAKSTIGNANRKRMSF